MGIQSDKFYEREKKRKELLSLKQGLKQEKRIDKQDATLSPVLPPILSSVNSKNSIEENENRTNRGLRSYQIEGVNRIIAKWTEWNEKKEGKRSILFQMPTGTGKTVLFSEIVRRGHAQNKRILIVVHTQEILEQIVDKLKEHNVSAGIIWAKAKPDYSKIVQVAMIQTLSKRVHPNANLVIIDECHHAKADTYKKLWDIYPDAKFLGVTATPWRLSGEGFDDLFNELIVSWSINEFLDRQPKDPKDWWLVPVKHYGRNEPDLSRIKKKQGDYDLKMLSNVMMDNSIMADVVESYKKKCLNKSAIVFAVDVEHSKEIVKRFREAGVIAEHIDSDTPKEEREQILKNFREKQIQVVSNVRIITEGFDFPACDAVLLARPTKSLALYLQMVGRVQRPSFGKTEGIILDNAGLWYEHGLSTMDRQWTLAARNKNKNKLLNYKNQFQKDQEGVIREIIRKPLKEVKGLDLVLLNSQKENLRHFDSSVSKVFSEKHRLHHYYYSYKENIEKDGRKLSWGEFEYMKEKLSLLSKQVGQEIATNGKLRAIHPNFWDNEMERFMNPTAETRRNTFKDATKVDKGIESLNWRRETQLNDYSTKPLPGYEYNAVRRIYWKRKE